MGTGAPPYEAPEELHSVIRRHAIESPVLPFKCFISSTNISSCVFSKDSHFRVTFRMR